MKKKIKINPYIYILLSMLCLITFIYYPAIKTMIKSLYLVNAQNRPVKFIGLENYIKLFSDPEFINSIKVTFTYALVVVPCTLLISLILALFSSRKRKMSVVYELLYAVPMAVSVSVACVVFSILLNGNLGLINHVFHLNVQWFTDKNVTLIALMFIGIWLDIGMNYLFMLSAVRGVPAELLEAAEIDGAGILQKVKSIIAPLISPTVFYLFCVDMGAALMMSGPVIILTNGGPSGATNTMIYYMYKKGFYIFNYGLSYAAAVIAFIIGFIAVLIAFVWERKGVKYS
ncbi:MAG: sugar ABC transporter permease [Lachnospiraceae bacterium]|nr:sugar ABC transporter permease [Lachnospiraceae bacterium]